MKTKVFFTIALLAYTFEISAQQQTSQVIMEFKSVMENEETIKTKLLNYGIEILDIDLTDQTVVIRYISDNKYFGTKKKKNDMINKIKETIIHINTKPLKDYKKKPMVAVPEKLTPLINQYLDIDNESIFSDSCYARIANIDVAEIPLRSRSYFLLVRNIYNLKSLVQTIENRMKEDVGEAPERNDSIESQLEAAMNIYDIISNTDQCVKSCLSESQNKFYQDLVKKLDERNGEFYSK
ncbi:MAG: hypothetical protein LBN06_04000 [Prevotellaceae bacterium]|jgi:hypothetical protein|nr:hypothetical protein [Prevotellaceae bacterium]